MSIGKGRAGAMAGYAGIWLAGAAAVLTPQMALAASKKAPPLYLETPEGQKPRVVITADPELDDNNSLIRYLLYSTDYRTEGLVYASSQFHWTGDGKGTKLSVPGREYTRIPNNPCPCTSWRWSPDERFIDDAVAAYSKAYPNLKVHNKDYPTPELLKSKIRWGNVQFDGEMDKDTPGSDLIKKLLLDDEEAPIYLHAWGGGSTIARALKSIEDQYKGTGQWAAIRAKVIRKAILHFSGDQDDTYVKYIKPNWPEIRYRQLAGGLALGYNAQNAVSLEDAAYLSADWMEKNISSRGSLGERERVWGDGKQMVKGDIFDFFGLSGKSADELRKEGYVVWTPLRDKGEFLGEGDTDTFLNLVNNGLRGYRGNSFGGWGGYSKADPTHGGFGSADFAAMMANMQRGERKRAPTHPFLAAAQRDWAERFKWAVTPTYAGANHNPSVSVVGPHQIVAKPGQVLKFSTKSSDPDGDKIAFKWWNWKEAGTYKGDLAVTGEAGGRASLTIPADAKPGDMFQIIVEASDVRPEPLSHYDKVLISIAK